MPRTHTPTPTCTTGEPEVLGELAIDAVADALSVVPRILIHCPHRNEVPVTETPTDTTTHGRSPTLTRRGSRSRTASTRLPATMRTRTSSGSRQRRCGSSTRRWMIRWSRSTGSNVGPLPRQIRWGYEELLPSLQTRMNLDAVKELGFLQFDEAEKKKDAILFNGLVSAWGDVSEQACKFASTPRSPHQEFDFDEDEDSKMADGVTEGRVPGANLAPLRPRSCCGVGRRGTR